MVTANGEHCEIDAGVAEPRDPRGRGGDEHFHAAVRERQADADASEAEYGTLGEELAHDAATART